MEMNMNTYLSIDRLSISQVDSFVQNISVKTSLFSGEIMFSATIDFNGRNREIVATTKEIYNKLEKLRLTEDDLHKCIDILEKFVSIEQNYHPFRITKIFNRVVYNIFEFISPKDYSETWSNKFIAEKNPSLSTVEEKKLICSHSDDSYIPHTSLANWEALERVRGAFNAHFDGTEYNKVVVNVISRQQGDILASSGGAWCGGRSARKYFTENFFYNPKALIVTINDSAIYRDDLTVPEDALCTVCTLSKDEYEALPAVSYNMIEVLERKRVQNLVIDL